MKKRISLCCKVYGPNKVFFIFYNDKSTLISAASELNVEVQPGRGDLVS